jgi:hypothetical protein
VADDDLTWPAVERRHSPPSSDVLAERLRASAEIAASKVLASAEIASLRVTQASMLLDFRLDTMAKQVAALELAVEQSKKWRADHEAQLNEFVSIVVDLRLLIANRLWLSTTKKVIAWLGGAIIAVLLFYHTLLPLLPL